MPILFEYGKWESIKNKNALKQMLKDIWEKRLFVDANIDLTEEEKDSRYQPFLQFYDSEIKANNFVGFIQIGDEIIEIYPKIFRNHLTNPTSSDKKIMLQHIFYWFNYCRKWKFPFNQALLDAISIDKFPELIINLIANQILEIISNQPLTMYQEVEEVLSTPRGSINFKRYLNNSLAYGNFQEIECDYEPFLFDNKVNRAIKYCSRLLLNQTQFSENLQMLQNIIFILGEVEDLPCTTHDISKIHLNSFFDDYSILLDSCKLILNQQLYSSNIYDLSQWCLLFPMEYIFEDFVAGFLEKNFSKDWRIHYQKSEMKLATDSTGKDVFKMQHDIFLTHRATNKEIIIDTKYKIREQNFKQDNKKGIAQNDLYQMTSYSFRRGCTDILLVYPNLSDNIQEADKFQITSGFEGKETINVTAIEIPFWTINYFNASDIDERLFRTIETNLNKLIE